MGLSLRAGGVDPSRDTAVAVARSRPCGVETGVAFAGEKWLILVRFPFTDVSLVSMVAVQG